MQAVLDLVADGRKFDLVVSGALCDYLPNRGFVTLLRTVYRRLLLPGGTSFFANMAKGNPYRAWMEYLVDWRLAERTEQQLRLFDLRLCELRSEPSDCPLVAEFEQPEDGVPWILLWVEVFEIDIPEEST